MGEEQESGVKKVERWEEMMESVCVCVCGGGGGGGGGERNELQQQLLHHF